MAQMLRQLRVLGHLPVLAVDRNEKARAHQIQHQPQLLRAAVTGNVDRRIHGAVDHVRAAPGDVIHHPVNGFFVAGNDARAERHHVAGLDRQMLVIVDGHARQRRHRLALRAARRSPPALLGAVCIMSCGRSRMPLGMVSRPRSCAISVVLFMLRPRNATLRPYSSRQIENLLQAVNGGAEAGDHQSARRAHEQIFQARADGALALGVAGPVDVGRIRHQQQHAALAVLGQRVQIEQLVVGGRGVHLEIAGVNDDAERRGDGQRDAAHDGMRDVNELDRERPQRQLLAGLDLVELGLDRASRALRGAVRPAPA